MHVEIHGGEEGFAYIVGLEPNRLYDIEVDGEELTEARTDSGGILALTFPVGRKTGVRINPATPLLISNTHTR